MQNRKAHCGFAKFNRNGRCIANCAENIERGFDSDCTGNTGSTADYEKMHEVRVSCQFIDGSNRVDADGQPIIPEKLKPQPEPEAKPSYTSYGWGTYIDNFGKVFRFEARADGSRYRRYIT
jgi:hypothetical protein